jgi:hypothetical protein
MLVLLIGWVYDLAVEMDSGVVTYVTSSMTIG